MDNFQMVQNNNNDVVHKRKDVGLLKNGLNNIVLCFLSGFVFYFVIDNYLSYGIVKGPIEILFNFYDFLTETWWILILLPICLVVQICMCFIIEKCLALKILSEFVGMALHVFNTLFVMNVVAVISYTYKLHPVALHLSVGYVGVQFLKTISYVCVNQSYRKDSTIDQNHKNGQQNEENYDPNKKLLRYPHNITISNTIDFFVRTGSFIYNHKEVAKGPKNWKRTFQIICRGFLIYYVCALIIYQYIIPELEKTKIFMDNFEILNMMGLFFKLLFPVNVVWLLHYHLWCFSSYFWLYSMIWGTEECVFILDWWNSENMNTFWQKWNFQTHLLMKRYAFLPLKKKGYNKLQSALIVLLLSGLLHEYLVSIPFRSSYGFPTMAMLSQLPIAMITTHFHKTVSPVFGNYLTILTLFCGNTLSIMCIYYNYNN